MARQTTTRYQPTYRLESKNPYNREKCEHIIKDVVNNALETFVYNTQAAPTICKDISEEIKARVKSLDFDRYKLICVVSIGEKYMQSFTSVVKFLWDAEKDGYATYVHDTPNFFAVVTLYALYFD